MSFLERLLRGLGGHPGKSYRRGHGGSHHGGYRYQRGGSPTDYSPQQDMPPASADNACGKCGGPNGADAKFCQRCGASLIAKCTGCGAKLSADSKFCSQCGRPR